MIGWVLGLNDRWLYQILDRTGKYIFLANEGDPLTQRLQDFLQLFGGDDNQNKDERTISNIFIVKRRPGMNWIDCHKRDVPWTPKGFVNRHGQHTPYGKTNMIALFRNEQEYFKQHNLKSANQETLEKIAKDYRYRLKRHWDKQFGSQSSPRYNEHQQWNDGLTRSNIFAKVKRLIEIADEVLRDE